jgi:DNA-binding response OmpR family regulator
MKILIVEDEKAIALPVSKVLEGNGYVVECAYDGKTALAMAKSHTYDLLLLDLNLPEIDGITVAKELKVIKPGLPILMVTARSQLYDKLTGFSSGTDDYLTKPFAMDELVARVKALLRRSSDNKRIDLEFGEYTVTPANNMLTHKTKGDVIKLSNKEMGILEYLLRNRGSAVSAEQLLEHVWDSHVDLFTGTIKTHIKTLRSKLGKLGDSIETLKGKGYLIS